MVRAMTWVEPHPQEDLLALADEAGGVVVWDSRHGTVVRQLQHQGFVANVRWSPDGERLVVAELGGRLSVYDRAGQPLKVVETGHKKLCSIAFHSSGKQLVSGGVQGRAIVWSGEDFHELVRLPVDKGEGVSAVCFAGESLVLGCEDGFFEAWSGDGKEYLAGGQVVSGRVASVAATPSGDTVIFGGGRGSMMAVSAGPKWTCVETWRGTPPRPIAANQISFSPDGTHFLVACSDDTAQWLDWKGRKSLGDSLGTAFYLRSPKPEWTRDMIVASACCDRARPLCYTARFDGTVEVWLLDGWPKRKLKLTLEDGVVKSLAAEAGPVAAAAGASSLWQATLG
jgi:WD40 repeat protein